MPARLSVLCPAPSRAMIPRDHRGIPPGPVAMTDHGDPAAPPHQELTRIKDVATHRRHRATPVDNFLFFDFLIRNRRVQRQGVRLEPRQNPHGGLTPVPVFDFSTVD